MFVFNQEFEGFFDKIVGVDALKFFKSVLKRFVLAPVILQVREYSGHQFGLQPLTIPIGRISLYVPADPLFQCEILQFCYMSFSHLNFIHFYLSSFFQRQKWFPHHPGILEVHGRFIQIFFNYFLVPIVFESAAECQSQNIVGSQFQQFFHVRSEFQFLICIFFQK